MAQTHLFWPCRTSIGSGGCGKTRRALSATITGNFMKSAMARPGGCAILRAPFQQERPELLHRTARQIHAARRVRGRGRRAAAAEARIARRNVVHVARAVTARDRHAVLLVDLKARVLHVAWVIVG